MRAALLHHHDAGGDVEHHVHVVLAEEDGQALLARQALNQPHRGGGLLGRHARGGLVQDEELGFVAERDGDFQDALVPVRKRPGQRGLTVAQPHPLQDLPGFPDDQAVRRPEEGVAQVLLRQDRDLHVPEHGQAREDVGDLEGARDSLAADLVRGLAPDVLALEQDPPLVGLQVAGDQVEKRGFAGAVRTDDGDEVARVHPELGPVHGLEIPKGFAEGLNLQHRLIPPLPATRGVRATAARTAGRAP